ncbi:MAG: hypothetical protein WC087_01665 [Candidatus Paceibacterota bacterium]
MATSSRLTQGLFGTEHNRKSDLFGLKCGQMCAGKNRITRNAGWYNKEGEKIGWGDLDVDNLVRISTELEDDEIFIVLSEEDSHSRFIYPHPATEGVSEEAPGIEYVAKHSYYIIAPRVCYYVDGYGRYEEKPYIRDTLQFSILTPQEAAEMLLR